MEEYKCLRKKFNFNEKKKKKSKLLTLINVCLISALLLVGNLILCKTNTDYKNFVYKYVYSHNFSFSKIEKELHKYFGDFIPISKKEENTSLVFGEKLVYLSLKEIENGVTLTVSEGEIVSAFEGGVVVFNGIKEGFGNTLIVEQIDGNEAWYVNLDTTNIPIYDYIEKGETIGPCLDNQVTLYFKNKGETVDYKKYIS